MQVRAKLVEIYSRVVKLAKEDNEEIYLNGDNNLYPNEIEGVINNSPIAFSAAKIMTKFIGGLGVENNLTVNKEKNYTLNDIVRMFSKSIANHNAVPIYIGYGINEEGKIYPNKLDVLECTKIRLSKEDSEENKGRIFYKDYESKSSFGKKNKARWFYPFNSNQDVIHAQIERDLKDSDKKYTGLAHAIRHYRGQVYYLNLTPEYTYALAPVDSVFNDADSDYRIGLYTNKQVRSGFLGKTTVITQGLDEETQKIIEEDIKKFLGAENSDSIFQLSVKEADRLDDVIKFIQLKPQFDDKLFVETNSRISKNILIAFNNIPEPLISAGSGALFGTTSETYLEMKLFYSEQTADERKKLEETLTTLGFPCKIIPMAEKK